MPTVRAGFVVWDDDDHVYENPHITAVDGYRKAWLDWRDTAFYPLTFTTFYLEWRLANGEPWLFHLNNVVLHAANGVGVGLLGRAIGLPYGLAWAAAGIWALHPVEVASVAWITERKNVLYVFFYLAALLGYARSLDGPPSRSRRFWLLSLGLAVASHLSKATAVTLPVAVLLLHWTRGQAFDRKFAGRLLSYLALSVAIGLLHVGREEVEAPLGLETRVLIATRAIWFYVLKFLWPVDLVAMYPRWSTEGLSWGLPALAGLAVAIAVGGCWYFRRLPRSAWFAAAHFAVNISLVIGVIWFPYMRHSFVADHLAYLANIGLALLVSLGAQALLQWLTAPVALRAALVVGVWLVLAGASREQTGLWHDTEALWTKTLKVNPLSTTAHNNLGVALLERGQKDEARAHFEESLRIDPDDPQAILNLGVMAAGRADWVEAITLYKKALRHNFANPYVWNNLGVAAAERGDTERAAAFYEHALKLDPDDATTHTNLGAALAKLGDHEAALKHHEAALRLNPRLMKAHYNMAVALSDTDRHGEAAAHLRAARELAPDDLEIRTRLASSLSAQGDLRGASEELTAALERDPNDASVHYDLGMVLSELGEGRRALDHVEKALELAPEAVTGALHMAVGLLLEELGELDRAIAHHEKAAELAPDDADTLYTLGATLSAAGHHEEAATWYRRVLALAPDHMEATNNLGAALLAEGNTQEAISYFERALRLSPEDIDARRNLAVALYEMGRVGDALPVLEQALVQAPELPELANLMAWVRATSQAARWRNGAEAVRLAESACALADPANPNYLDTLAAAYAEAGRFPEAVRTARRALELADGGSELAQGLRRRLALYESERPYRE
jgi:tetratricopeptide (TPR) repeat protein